MRAKRLAIVLSALLSGHVGAAAASPADTGNRLAQCAAPATHASDIVVDSGSGGFAIEAIRDRHWLELAGRASLALRLPDGREVAQVRIHLPAAGQYGRQQQWREHALLDAAARGGGRIRLVDLTSNARLVTLNKASLEGRFAGVSLLSDAGLGMFIQWNWKMLEEYTDGGTLAAAQQAILQPLLACLLVREAR